MKIFENYERVVATKEKSAGNSEVGDMWVETKTFDKNCMVHEIISWAGDCTGKLIITIDEADAESKIF